MVISEQNRGSYFLMKIKLPNYGLSQDKDINNKIESKIDIILANATATHNVYKFDSNKNDQFIYLFSTKIRKRKGQIEKLIEKNLQKDRLIRENEFQVIGLLKSEFNEYLQELKQKESLQITSEPINFEGYKGNDIKIFQNKENWYEWQISLYNKIFYKSGEIKEPDPRKILFLYDSEGGTGKSSFFKHLYFTYPDRVARLSYGSSQQLRSALVQLSSYQIYIIDLARTKGKSDSPSDLISVLEDLKTGLICSAMYGNANNLLIEPPHIIVSSNFLFNIDQLSKDRWLIEEIKNKKLVDITEKVKRRQARDKMVKK